MTRNATLVHITEKLFNWIVDSGMVDLATGNVYDGVDTVACTVSASQWSYSYGVSRVFSPHNRSSRLQQLVGGLSFLYSATGNSSYLDYTKKITTTAINRFAPTGVVEELCEATGTCNQDQQGFKVDFHSIDCDLLMLKKRSQAIFLRQLTYLYLITKDVALKSSISAVIQMSANAALATCDSAQNCTGGWTANSTQVYPAFRSTHLVAAALVAVEGIKGVHEG
jgi:mannan endo-1,6-alpha-mannosidase